MIEYHKLTQHYGNNPNMYQTFITRVNRTNDEIELLDMWIITRLEDHQTRLRLDLKNYLNIHVKNIGEPMTDHEVLELHDFFDDILDVNAKQELVLDFLENYIEQTQQDQIEQTLIASDIAECMHPILTIQEQVNAQLSNNLRKES